MKEQVKRLACPDSTLYKKQKISKTLTRLDIESVSRSIEPKIAQDNLETKLSEEFIKDKIL